MPPSWARGSPLGLIHQALFVQGKGGLHAELATGVSCGRTRYRRLRSCVNEARGKITGIVSISQLPTEAVDRVVSATGKAM